MSFITVAAATLPSVPLDFGGNRDRILRSIKIAKKKGATLRTGPELEIPGYGCLDHHLEGDTFLHSWVILPHPPFPPFIFPLFFYNLFCLLRIRPKQNPGSSCRYYLRSDMQRYADRRRHGGSSPKRSIVSCSPQIPLITALRSRLERIIHSI
jgi:hypothetical protein